MVYRGKPSRACLECRVKRRKCDLSKPACGQCVRAGSKCDGYRDQNSLTFQDQTAQTLSKPQSFLRNNSRPVTLLHENQAVSTTETTLCQQGMVYQSKKEPDNDPWRRISISPQDLALSFFFYHYLMSGSGSGTGPALSHPDCVSIMYTRAAEGGYLADLINAVGVTSLAYVKNAPALTHVGARIYSGALRSMRVALADPIEASSDQMLVAVMLLVLYETVIWNADSNLSLWDRHMDGALALVELRGMCQFRNRIGRSIFLNLRTRVLVNCLQRRLRVPETLTKWMNEFQEFEPKQEAPAGRLAGIIVSACAVLASVQEKVLDGSNISGCVSALLFIDEALNSWAKGLAAKYRYSKASSATKIPGKDATDIFSDGQYRLYTGMDMVHTWNLQRCARITLRQNLIEILSLLHIHLSSSSQPTLSYLPYNYEHLVQTSNTIIQENSSDICDSIPYILHYGNNKPGSTSGDSDMRAACILPLLWPLYVAGTAPTTTNTGREWIIVQMRKIGDVTGIQRAKSMALEIQKGMLPIAV
ncbi:hypothetical protein BJY01DRAFT_221132 [Aspergillus pseudoustus]|uniref:Zn(2)-C6 fungal-type domain-containing protein n=1 Tax=Aspergillus pseudoustus TaxID=1810923 RepID=A0ABR4JB61_9EURO